MLPSDLKVCFLLITGVSASFPSKLKEVLNLTIEISGNFSDPNILVSLPILPCLI